MYRPLVPVVLLLALGSSGCFFVGDDDDDFPRHGTLLVDWTVEGSHTRAACRETGADAIDIAISTDGGRLVDEFQDPCEAFEVSVDLLPGTYVIDAVLLDPGGADLTTTVSDRVFIDPGALTVSAVDFPTDSFL